MLAWCKTPGLDRKRLNCSSSRRCKLCLIGSFKVHFYKVGVKLTIVLGVGVKLD